MTAAVAGLTGLCLTRGRKWIIPSVVWVLLMAISRNYLMAHYPSDVLFGLLVGLIAAAIAYAITLLIFRLLKNHREVPLCALLLDFDLPVRLPGRSARFEDDLEADDEEESFESHAPAVEAAPVRKNVSGSHSGSSDRVSSAPRGYQGKHLK